MASFSVLQSFDRELPDAVRFESPGPTASPSGPSTRDAYPPRNCTAVGFQHWDRIAQQVLNVAGQYLGGIAAPLFEPTRCIDTEGDVVNAAAVHLNYPVDFALDAMHQDEIIALNEGEALHRSRADRAYSTRYSPSRFFAVVEFKSPNTIQPDEFRRAIQTSASRTDRTRWHVPPFLANSSMLMKQAVHYAKNYRTRYVCVFDYNSLLLLVLTDASTDDDGGVGDGGNDCLLTLVTDKRYMRRALLGFLEEAYQARRDDRRSTGPEGGRHTTGRGDEGSSSSYGGRRSDRRREDPRLTHY